MEGYEASMNQQIHRNRLTSAALSQTLPGSDDVLRVELENGITILSRSNFNSPSVAVQGYIQVGSLLDPDDKLGLANFTAAGLMRGTARRDFQDIYDALESAGASLSFSGGTLSTSFGGKALVEDLGMLLELLGQALAQPEFPAQQVDRLRAQYLTSLALRAQDTAAMAALKFDALLYAGHPYSRPEDGYPETVAAITREDLIHFHERFYGPKGMVVIVVGGLEPQIAVDQVASYLSGWSNPRQPDMPTIPPLPALKGAQRDHVTIAGKSQTDIVLGVTAPERRSPDFLPLAIANDILGQFGLYGRIGQSVRENAGLAYYAYSSLNCGMGPGAWYASTGVDPANVSKVVELIIAEFERMTSESIYEEELVDTKTNFIGRLPLGFETNIGVSAALLHIERYGLGLDYYRHYPALVEAVKGVDILQVARRYLLLENLTIASAGPIG
jgi:zinc protease